MMMRISVLFISLWIFSACMSDHGTSLSPEKLSTDKIRTNQSDAQDAMSEYKALQQKRTTEH